jgi:hypothetical protein
MLGKICHILRKQPGSNVFHFIECDTFHLTSGKFCTFLIEGIEGTTYIFQVGDKYLVKIYLSKE